MKQAKNTDEDEGGREQMTSNQRVAASLIIQCDELQLGWW